MWTMKIAKPLFQAVLISVLFTCILWWIKLSELFFHLPLNELGISPMQVQGLWGIAFAPLIHGSLGHIFSNTLALLFLGSLFIYGYPRSWKKASLLIWLGSGLGVWLFARHAVHIGASGLTHGLFFFLLVASILRRDKRSVALMMMGVVLYGGMMMSIFPREEHISFEYHFFGALFGALAALLFSRADPKPVIKRFTWEESPELEDPIIGEQWRQSSSDDGSNQ